MVARDHDRSDTRCPRRGHGVSRLGSWRVGHRDQPQEREARLGSTQIDGQLVKAALGQGQHAVALGRVAIGGGPRTLPRLVVDGIAERREGLDAALHRDPQSALIVVDGRHPPTIGVEGDLRDARPSSLEARAIDAKLARQSQEGALRGIPGDRPRIAISDGACSVASLQAAAARARRGRYGSRCWTASPEIAPVGS